MKLQTKAAECLLALSLLIPSALRAQNLQVIMTNNTTTNASVGTGNNAGNFQNLGNTNNGNIGGLPTVNSNPAGWSSSSTTAANVLINLTNNAVVTWGTTSAWQAQSLNVTNGNTVTIEPLSGNAGARIAIGNASASITTASTNQWGATNANAGFEAVFLTNNSQMLITTNGASPVPTVQLYYATNNFDIAGGSTLTLNGSVTGGSGFAFDKVGAGMMIVNGAWTSAGTILIDGGTLQLGNAGTYSGALGAKGAVDNATLSFKLTNASTLWQTSPISGTGQVVQNGTGTVTLLATNTYSGGTVINSGTIKAYNSNSLGVSTNTLTFGGAGTLDLAGVATNSIGGLNGSTGVITNSTASSAILNLTVNGTNSFGGVIKDNSAAKPTSLQFASGSTGSQTLTGANLYTGGTVINGGTVVLGNASALGASTATLNVSGGTLNLGGLSVTEGATTIGGGSVTNGTLNPSSFTATNNGGVTIAANIASGSVTASGTGNLNLTGSNTYSGGTTINAGATVTASSLGSGALSDSGTLNDASSTALTVGAVTLNGGTIALQQVGGTVTSSAGITLTGSANVINLGNGWTNGTYSLISGTSITGSVISVTGNLLGGNSVALGNTLTNGRTTFGLAANSGSIQLTIGGGPANLNWTAAVSQTWDTQTTANWYNTTGGSNDVFYTGDNVTFTSNGPVSVTASGVGAGTITVNNPSGTTISMGGGTVSASANMIVNGGGLLVASNTFNMPTASLVISNASTAELAGTNNSFAGITVAGGSTLTVDKFSAVGGTTVSVNGASVTLNTPNINATINSGVGGATINSSGSQTLSGSLTGNGGYTMNGTGTVVLAASNTQSGGITINSGDVVQVGAGAATGSLGSSSSPVTNNGGLLFNLTNNTVGQSISGSGSVTYSSGSGTITPTGVNTYTGGTLITAGSSVALTYGGTNLPGNVTNNGSIYLINNSSKGNVNLAANISGSGSLWTTTNGTTLILGSNSYSGGTTINGGTLQVGNGGTSGNLPSTGSITVAKGATLAFNQSGTVTVSNAVTGSGRIAQAGTGTLAIGFDNSANSLGLGWSAPGTIYITNANALPTYDPVNQVGFISNSATPVGSHTATLAVNIGTDNSLTINNPLYPNATLAFDIPAGQTVIADGFGLPSASSKGAIAMSGQGTLVLANPNGNDSGSNAVIVNSGTFQIANGAGNIMASGLTMYGGVLDLGNQVEGVGQPFSFYGGTTTNGYLRFDKNSQIYGSVTFNSYLMNGSNNTLAAGASPYTVTLGMDNTTNNGTGIAYTGNWNVQSNASILLNNAGGLGSGTTTISAGGRLDVNGNTVATLDRNVFSVTNTSVLPNVTNNYTNSSLQISGAGPDGKGALYDGSVAGTGTVTGFVTLGGNAAVGAADALNIAANITDRPNASTSATNPQVPGAYTLTVAGGQVALTGSNSFATNAVAASAWEVIQNQANLGATNGISVAGTLQVLGSVNLSNLNTVFVMNNSLNAGVDFGQMLVSLGTLTYGGNLTIQSTQFGLTPFSVDLFNASRAINGDFNSVTMNWGSDIISMTESSGVWSGTDTNTGTSFTFTDSSGILASTPEPSSYALLGVGLVALVLVARHRRLKS
jgi:fibronectin-binding autotransporter adhesin